MSILFFNFFTINIYYIRRLKLIVCIAYPFGLAIAVLLTFIIYLFYLFIRTVS